LTAAINYTYSHSLDTTSNGGVEGFNLLSSSTTYPLTQIDPSSPDRLNYGNSDYDNRHNLSVNFVWQLPYQFHNLIAKEALQGWAISGTLFDKSGVPFSVIRGSMAGYWTGSTNAGSVLGAFLGGSHPSCNRPSTTPCLITSQYATQATQYLYGFGTQARNSYRGPGYFNSDMQLSKTTSVGERVKFKIGANAFNIFNHAQFNNPGSSLGCQIITDPNCTTNFGVVTSTRARGREGQFGAKFFW